MKAYPEGYTTLRPIEKLEPIVAKLNADPDEDWTYKAVQTGEGLGFIAVYDESMEYLGSL